jgi:glucokinase
MNPSRIAIGADVGGSHISCAAIDLIQGRVIAETEQRAPVNNGGSAAEIFRQWALALNASIAALPAESPVGIGFAMPGPFDYRDGISKMQHKFSGIYGENIPAVLQGLLSTPLPMRFLNDAIAFAAGEAWLGQGSGYERVVAITLGTGFGSAFVEAGAPVTERADVPQQGCLWHLPFEQGIADDYFSTRWLVQAYEQETGRSLPHAKAVADACPTDAIAQRLFERFGENLARFIGPWLQRFRAEVLVMGGNITGAYAYFGPAYEQGLQAQGLALPSLPSLLGEQAAMIGSARLFDLAFWGKTAPQLAKML